MAISAINRNMTPVQVAITGLGAVFIGRVFVFTSVRALILGA
jgi:hypothetical protein